MSEAEIDGKPVSLEAAAERSAKILLSARMPIVAGLGTDVAGARVSISLMERLRGAYDHLQSDRIFADLDVMRQAGLMFTTPSEARLRADVLLFIGNDLTRIWPAMMERLSPGEMPPFDLAHQKRKVFWIAPSRSAAKAEKFPIETLDTTNLHATLASLRARFSGKPINAGKAVLRKLDEFAEVLKNARFGVAVWGGDMLDSLSVEMLYGLITDINKTTRFTGLPLGAENNAAGVLQTSGWMTGFPMRTSFGRGYPEHDSWRFDANRMIESGEADAALWISSYGREVPSWKKQVPLIALVPPKTKFARVPQVRIEVGQPGIDHDAAEFARETGTIVGRDASHTSEALSVAAVVGQIAQHIGRDA